MTGCGRLAVIPTLFIVAMAHALGGDLRSMGAGSLGNTSAVVLMDGVIVGPVQSVLYVMQPGGGIEALEPSSGKTIWSTSRAVRPLVVSGRFLVGQADGPRGATLRLVALDRDSGQVVFQRDVELPEGVCSLVDATLAETFTSHGRIEGNRIIIYWRYRLRPVSGLKPGPGAAGSEFEAHGAVHVDPASQSAIAMEGIAEESGSSLVLPDRVASALDGAKLLRPPWPSGKLIATVQRLDDGGRILLRRWHAESGEPLLDIDLGTDVRAIKYASADGRHFLTGRRTRGSTDQIQSIYTVESGERLTLPGGSVAFTRFLLSDHVLIHESRPHAWRTPDGTLASAPLQLRAIDISSGKTIWERDVRDTAYQGPYPPGQPSN
jgi:hypothetical protein